MKEIFDFVGSHSTGKTTIMERLVQKVPNSAIATSVSRNDTQKHGLILNSEIDDVQQSYISLLNWDRILFNPVDTVFCTDMVVRSLAYAMAAKKLSPEMIRLHRNFLTYLYDDPTLIIHTFYIPIEFALVGDGVRDEALSYQKLIDSNITQILREFRITFHTLTGSVENRVETAYNYIMG